MVEWKEVSSSPIHKFESKGEIVEGKFVGIRDGQFGALFDVETKNGKISLPSDTVLIGKLSQELVGKEIQVEYLGEQPSTKRRGKSYRNYKVSVRD